jgi:hypothetical protein
MQVAQLHHPCSEPAAGVVLKQNVVRRYDGGTTASLQSADDVFDEGKLFIGCVGSDGKVASVGPASPLLGAEGRIGKNQVCLWKRLTVRG